MKRTMRRLGMGLVALIAVGTLGWMVMALWNAVVPSIFVGARVIDFWHALGLLVLSRILFGGFRGHRGWRRHGRRRWNAMSPQERERFRERFAARCGRRAEGT